MLSINSSLGDIKKEFTRITRLPAKKSFAAVVAAIGNRKMQSKTDWLWILENIEMVLVPITERTKPQQIEEPEIPAVEEVQPQPEDSEVAELCSAALESENPEQVFVEAFATADDAKSIYRRLAKFAHPDKGGNSSLFQLISNAYSEYQKNASYYQEAYAVEQQSAEDFSGSTLSDEELRSWLS